MPEPSQDKPASLHQDTYIRGMYQSYSSTISSSIYKFGLAEELLVGFEQHTLSTMLANAQICTVAMPDFCGNPLISIHFLRFNCLVHRRFHPFHESLYGFSAS